MGVVSHLESASTTPRCRAACGAVQPDVSEFLSSIALSEGVCRRAQGVRRHGRGRGARRAAKRFLDKTLADFRRNGADLDAAGKKRLSAIDVELATLTLRYSQNVLDATNAFELVVEDRCGPRRPARAGDRGGSRERGKDRGVEATASRSRRRATSRCSRTSTTPRSASGCTAPSARAARTAPDNRPLLRAHPRAPAREGEDSSASRPSPISCSTIAWPRRRRARRFIDVLRHKTEPPFDRENDELAPPSAARSRARTRARLAAVGRRLLRREAPPRALRFRRGEAAPVLPARARRLRPVRHRRALYGVRVEPWQGAPVWHRAVRAFVVRVEPDGARRRRLLRGRHPARGQARRRLDARARHTAPARTGRDRPGRAPLEVLAGNVTPPLEGRPALLSHREVETMFHEFGHLMHHARAACRSEPRRHHRRLGLRRAALADHGRTGAGSATRSTCSPATTRRARRSRTTCSPRMRAARTFRAATMTMRQLGFAEVDLALHMEWTGEQGDVVGFARGRSGVTRPSRAPRATPRSRPSPTSGPVGYAAGYYSYKWAEVLDADAFSRPRKGLFSRKAGDAFRARSPRSATARTRWISTGASRREPTIDALLQRSGLAWPPRRPATPITAPNSLSGHCDRAGSGEA